VLIIKDWNAENSNFENFLQEHAPRLPSRRFAPSALMLNKISIQPKISAVRGANKGGQREAATYPMF
jgi:hypothetical protein